MNEQQYNQVLEATKEHLAKGGKISRGVWGIYLKTDGSIAQEMDCICPLSALIFKHEDKFPIEGIKSPEGAAGHILNARFTLVESFITGFDGTAKYKKAKEAPEEMRAWYLAGERMRAELNIT